MSATRSRAIARFEWGVMRSGRRLRRLAVPAEIRADDRVALGQEWRDSVPRRMRPRVGMQEEDRRPAPPYRRAASPADVDELEREAVER